MPDPYGLVPTTGGHPSGPKPKPKPKKPSSAKKPARPSGSPGNLIQEAIAHAPGSTTRRIAPASQTAVRPPLHIVPTDKPVISLGDIGRIAKKVYNTGQKPKKPSPSSKKPSDPKPAGLPFGGKDPFTNKPWSAITGADLKNQQQTVQDYVAHPTPEPFGFGTSMALLGKQPSKLTNKEYDALRKAASKGNRRAQQILDHEHYKAVGYPSPAKDIQKALAPFTAAIQTQLPQDAQAIQTQINNVVANQNYDAQLPTLTSDMASAGIPGVTAPPAPSQSTLNFMNQLQSIVGSAPNFSTQVLPGIPSMDQAIADLGKAATVSNRAVSSEDLINALLQHQQTEIVYGSNAGSALANFPLGDFPQYVQNLIASVGGANSQSTSALLGNLPGLNANTNATVNQALSANPNPSVAQ